MLADVNDTDIPLAFDHISLLRHLAARRQASSIDRFHNVYKSPYIEPNERWHRHNILELEGEPVTLDAPRRKSLSAPFAKPVKFGWHLHALNVRTNHVHAVVCIGTLKPKEL
jgi:hypothetical protein